MIIHYPHYLQVSPKESPTSVKGRIHLKTKPETEDTNKPFFSPKKTSEDKEVSSLVEVAEVHSEDRYDAVYTDSEEYESATDQEHEVSADCLDGDCDTLVPDDGDESDDEGEDILNAPLLHLTMTTQVTTACNDYD